MDELKQLEILNQMIAEKEESIEPTVKMIQFLKKDRDNLLEKIESAIKEESKEIVNLFEENFANNVWVDLAPRHSWNGWNIVEDDGALIITKGNIVASFICDQECKKSDWNREAKKIMESLNVPKNIRANGLQ